MKKRLIIAAVLSSMMVLTACSGKSDDGTITITNVSYDPTREFYESYNTMFEEYYKKTYNKKVQVIQSHGGSGSQAYRNAMTMNGVFAMSAITALTAQNTTGVSGIFEVSPEFLAQQIDAVFTDIRPCAVKIGMVSSAPLIETIAARLRFY